MVYKTPVARLPFYGTPLPRQIKKRSGMWEERTLDCSGHRCTHDCRLRVIFLGVSGRGGVREKETNDARVLFFEITVMRSGVSVFLKERERETDPVSFC